MKKIEEIYIGAASVNPCGHAATADTAPIALYHRAGRKSRWSLHGVYPTREEAMVAATSKDCKPHIRIVDVADDRARAVQADGTPTDAPPPSTPPNAARTDGRHRFFRRVVTADPTTNSRIL